MGSIAAPKPVSCPAQTTAAAGAAVAAAVEGGQLAEAVEDVKHCHLLGPDMEEVGIAGVELPRL